LFEGELVPLKVKSVVRPVLDVYFQMVPVAVPPPETVPPLLVVPYMFPWLSKVTPARGYAPFELLKLTTVTGPQ
jgi:hypothetical protein